MKKSESFQLKSFVRLFNKKYGTDYKLEFYKEESSIIDGIAVSYSGKWQELKIQLKDVKKIDTSDFIKSIFDKDVKVFNLNIFKLLNSDIKKYREKYGSSAKDVVLVFNVGVSEGWLRDFVHENPRIDSNFESIYCIGLPSSIAPNGFIFPLKELKNLKINILS